jgi:NTP pyrophosphatase (non-canonical NTP hydrolase)
MMINEYQKLIQKLAEERGFAEETVTEKFMMMVEEVGELGKAIRKSSGLKVDVNSKTNALSEEVADILFLLIDICNKLDIDLEKAFEAKEAKNKHRTWTNA